MKLSDKQLECLKLLIAGFNCKEIAKELDIDVTSVTSRLQTVRSNWVVANNYELVYKVTKAGLL